MEENHEEVKVIEKENAEIPSFELPPMVKQKKRIKLWEHPDAGSLQREMEKLKKKTRGVLGKKKRSNTRTAPVRHDRKKNIGENKVKGENNEAKSVMTDDTPGSEESVPSTAVVHPVESNNIPSESGDTERTPMK